MTGMPASFAFCSAGRMALLSCASRTRTLAPLEMSVSTSVSCCSLLRLASASMYVPPPASTVSLMFGWSCAAQRGCWKLFQETPTVQSPPAAADELAPALGATLAPPALGAEVAAPPPHAATTIVAMPTIAASFRIPMRVVLLIVRKAFHRRNRPYRPRRLHRRGSPDTVRQFPLGRAG